MNTDSTTAATGDASDADSARTAVEDGASQVMELTIPDGTDATADDLTAFNNLPNSSGDSKIQLINAPHASVLTEEVNNGPGAIDQNDFGAFDDTQTLASVVGVPIQTGTYENRLGTNNGEDLRKGVFQHHAIGVDASQGDGDLEVTLDYSDTLNTGAVVDPQTSGLVVAPADAEGLASGNSLADSAAPPQNDGSPAAGSALSEIDDISVENQAGEITIEFTATSDIDSEAFVLRLALTANNPADPGVEATGERARFLTVDQALIEHTASMSALDDDVDLSNAQDSDRYTMIETGPVAIDVSDRADIVGKLRPEDVNPQFSDQPDTGAFVAYEGSQVTLRSSPAVTGELDLIEIYEAETDSSGFYQLGSFVDDIGTFPGDTVHLDTSDGAIQRAREGGTDEFFLLFDQGDETQQVLLEIRDLEFSADWNQSTVLVSEDIQVTVNCEDKIGGEVELWIGEVGFGDFTFSDVDHVETDATDGLGEATLSVDPNADLSRAGEYAAVVAHQPSETIIPLGIGNDNTVTVEPGSVLGRQWNYRADGRSQYASPAVSSDRVFLGGLDDTVLALNRTTGNVAWQFDRAGALADSSPAYDSGTVYVGSGGGTVYALNATDGSEEWTYSTNSAVVSSPTVAGGTVYVGSNDGTMLAIDATSGTEQWTAEVGAPVYSTPAVDAGTVYVTTDDGRLLALDTSDGSQQQLFDTETELGHSSPTLSGDTVYVAADEVYAINTSTKSVKWQSSYGGATGSSPTVANGLVYVGAADGSVTALTTDGGAEEWTHPTGDAVEASPAVASGRVVIPSTDGTAYLLDASSGSELTTTPLDSASWSSPTVASDTVYLGARSGRIVALTNLDDPV